MLRGGHDGGTMRRGTDRIRLLRWMARRARLGFVLFGHGVTDGPVDPFVCSVHQPLEDLKRTIEFYERLGFDFISLQELIELSQTGFRRERPWIHLTFDDGYRNNLTLLAPYLREREIPWTLFVSTGHVERNRRFPSYLIRCAVLKTRRESRLPVLGSRLRPEASREERLRTCRKLPFKAVDKARQLEIVEWARSLLDETEWRRLDELHRCERVLGLGELRELARDPQVSLGAHNHNHVVLNAGVSAADVEYEMRTSRNWLRDNLHVDCMAYCYPNGQRTDFSATTRRICREAGYRVAFTTIPRAVGPETDPYEIPRKAIPKRHGRARRSMTRAILREFFKFAWRRTRPARSGTPDGSRPASRRTDDSPQVPPLSSPPNRHAGMKGRVRAPEQLDGGPGRC